MGRARPEGSTSEGRSQHGRPHGRRVLPAPRAVLDDDRDREICHAMAPRLDADGLWFVGDGSRPIGDLYTEGAISAGILGAREMVGA